MNLQLRPLTIRDLPFCNLLVRQAGWNQIDADWKRLMDLEPTGCFIGMAGGQDAGSIAFSRFPADPEKHIPSVAWISMVLVEKAFRGKGIGSEMFAQILKRLQIEHIDTIRLDATKQGRSIYLKYGFRDEYELIRFTRTAEKNAKNPGIRSVTNIDPFRIANFDTSITRTNRSGLMAALTNQENVVLWEHRSAVDGRTDCYVACRPGRTNWQIGPCLADSPHIALTAMDRALNLLRHENVVIDIPAENQTAVQWATDWHFTEQRRFMRMYLGTPLEDHPEKIFASFGPEKG